LSGNTTIRNATPKIMAGTDVRGKQPAPLPDKTAKQKKMCPAFE